MRGVKDTVSGGQTDDSHQHQVDSLVWAHLYRDLYLPPTFIPFTSSVHPTSFLLPQSQNISYTIYPQQLLTFNSRLHHRLPPCQPSISHLLLTNLLTVELVTSRRDTPAWSLSLRRLGHTELLASPSSVSFLLSTNQVTHSISPQYQAEAIPTNSRPVKDFRLRWHAHG